jgi:hypothetical protein
MDMDHKPRLLLLLGLLFCMSAYSQTVTSSVSHGDSTLFKTIRHMDSVMFDAFNAHDLTALKNVFAPNLEFFHDKGGLSDYETSMSSFGRVFSQVPDLHRELVPGTMEVWPIPGYGAVETGEHRFIHKENGQEIVGLYQFTQVWQLKDGVWKVTREISVGH